jgi:N-acetylglutamate synthase-like GNAT family acetyltransferase
MVKLTWRPYQNSDFPFFEDVISDSGKWRGKELKNEDLSHYIEHYDDLTGEWRIWEIGASSVAISYHIETASSNNKPWLGTILVKASERRKGIANSMITYLASELKGKGYRAIFAGVPIEEYEWSNFLSDCGFEQFKSEDNKGETFLIMVRPLE